MLNSILHLLKVSRWSDECGGPSEDSNKKPLQKLRCTKRGKYRLKKWQKGTKSESLLEYSQHLIHRVQPWWRSLPQPPRHHEALSGRVEDEWRRWDHAQPQPPQPHFKSHPPHHWWPFWSWPPANSCRKIGHQPCGGCCPNIASTFRYNVKCQSAKMCLE